MTQRTDAYTPLRSLWLRSRSVGLAQLLLLQSLSWLGVFSLLSSNAVLAQTESSIDVVVPTTTSKPPVVKSVPNPPQTTAAPVRGERLRSRISTSPAPVRGERLRQKLSPTLRVRDRSVRQVGTPVAPRLSVPTRSVTQPATTYPKPVQARPTRTQTATNAAANYNGAYIDPTEYKIGATRSYEPPNAVVLSERSTGCKAIARQGMSGSICGTPARRTQGAIAATRRINTARLARSQAPGWVTRGAVAVGRISPITVSPITASASNGRPTRRIAVPGQIASANIQPRSVFYYNRTPQPTGQFGNGNTRLMFPLTIPAPITSLFGWRIHPITGTRRFHSGTDLGASLGTPVLAAEAGKVAIADWLGGYGLAIVLEHEKFTQQTLYGHLSEIFVQPGDWVEQGTVIGRVGSTGNSTGPHLHFETRQLTDEGWVATDPSVQLEDAVAELVEALRTAQSNHKPASKG